MSKQEKSAKVLLESKKVSDLYVAAVIDKSGSMASKKEDIIGGFNTFIDKLAEDKEGDTILTMTLFDTDVTTPLQNVPIHKVAHLNDGTYIPGGNTALFDAIVMTIGRVDAHLAVIATQPRILLLVATDGEENSSRETTDLAIVRKLIEEKQKLGWAIIFLGENMDAWAAGTSLGIRGRNSKSINPDYLYSQSMSEMASSARHFKRAANHRDVAMHFFEPDDPDEEFDSDDAASNK
jgi:hypothetical protein